VTFLGSGTELSGWWSSWARRVDLADLSQLRAAGRDVLVGLAGRVPLLPRADVLTFVDVDSMPRRVYGKRETRRRVRPCQGP
jgi:hypothetical protein